MKVCIIPDVHLKPWIFDRAEEVQCDKYIFMGDLVDDFGAEAKDYEETFERVNRFFQVHPDAVFCWGNHDWAYYANKSCSGHRWDLHYLVLDWLEDFMKNIRQPELIHQEDGILFSHAGLSMDFFRQCQTPDSEYWDMPDKLDLCIEVSNEMAIRKDDRLWDDCSPLWVRPQYDRVSMHPHVQVVGHTPMKQAGYDANILSTDTFSTDSLGIPFGSQKLILLDTETKEYEEY